MKKGRIFIVDDIIKNVQVLANVLSDEGYEIEYTTDSTEAIDWIKSETFDLVLLDVMMPVMDGFEVCKEIRKDEKYKDLPIIFLTAKTEKVSIIKGFEAGGHDYVTKPFDSLELLARVKIQLELKRSKEELENISSELDTKVKERTKELEILNKANAEFLNFISSEIRKPLNDLKGSIYLLKDQPNTTKLADLIKVMDKSAQSLEDFSNTAIGISEIRNSNVQIITDKIFIKDIVEFNLFEFNEKLLEKGIELVINMEDMSYEANIDYMNEAMMALFGFILENIEDKSKLILESYSDSKLFKIIGIVKHIKSIEKMRLEGDEVDIRLFFIRSILSRLNINFNVVNTNREFEIVLQKLSK